MHNSPETRLAAAVLTQAAEDFINPEPEGGGILAKHELRNEALRFFQRGSRWHELAEFEFTEGRYAALAEQAVRLQPL